MRNAGRLLALVAIPTIFSLLCTSSPVEPLAGSGGSETEAMVLGSAFYPDSSTPATGAMVYLTKKVASQAGLGNDSVATLSTIVDHKGRFEIRNVPTGGYLLEIVDTTDAGRPSVLDAVTVHDKDSLVLPLRLLRKPGSVGGILERYSELDNVDVTILVRYKDFTVAATSPDSLGRFEFPYLAAKQYTVVVHPSTSEYVTSSTPVEVPSGGTFNMKVGLTSTEMLSSNPAYIDDSLRVKAILDSNGISGTVASRVELGGDMTIVRLDLRGEGITTIPEVIGDLSSLQELDLSTNRIRSLPSTIGRLTNLASLDVRNNLLTELPSEITYISTLRKLWLSNNAIKALPADIGKWRNLESMYVDTNKLTRLPMSIGNCETLKFLNVSENDIESLPSTLGLRAGLQSLEVAGNKLEALPDSLVRLKNLLWLDLSYNYLCDLPDALVSWASTYDVDWQGSQFCGTSPDSPYNFFSPKEGGQFMPGDTLRIRWKTTDPGIERVDISISADFGTNFYPIGNCGKGNDSWENYTWIIPDSLEYLGRIASLRSKECVLRISSYGNPGVTTNSEVFSIEGNPITVVSPNGGENYRIGDTLHIRWNTAVSMIDIVTCSLSVDDGISWHDAGFAIVEMADRWENVTWVIPQWLAADAGAVSDRCRVKVSAYGCSWGYCFKDISDNPFTVAP